MVAGDPLLQCPMLEVQVQGHPVHLVVDTGLSAIVFYEERLPNRVPGLRTTGHPADATMRGRVRAKQARIPDVLFGKTNRDVSVLLVVSPAPEMLSGVDGIMGAGVLNARHINFDSSGRTLDWQRRSFPEPPWILLLR